MAIFTETTEYHEAYARNWMRDLNATHPDRPLSAGYKVDVEGQKHGVRITVPLHEDQESGRVVLKFTPWSNGVDDDVDAAEAVALAASGARVISLGIPGIDQGTSKLTRSQRRALKRGDFGQLARAQIEAARKAYKLAFLEDMPDEVTIWGSSQGGSNAVAAAELLLQSGVNVRQLVIGSTPALSERRLSRLALDYFADGPKTVRALGRYSLPWREPADKDLRWKTLPVFVTRMLTRAGSHYAPAAALAKGLDCDRIFNIATRNTRMSVDFWAGENDPISPAERWQVLARSINAGRMAALALVHILPGMPHGVTSDVNAISVMARRVHLGTR